MVRPAAIEVSVGQVTMYPILGYRDLPAAIDWLCRVFSFEPLEVMKNEDGTYAHVELRLGAGVIMPTTKRDEVNPDNPWEGPIGAQGLYVALEKIEAHYERAVAEGAEIVRPLTSTNWGSREYTARDVEGNLWAFGTYRPAAS